MVINININLSALINDHHYCSLKKDLKAQANGTCICGKYKLANANMEINIGPLLISPRWWKDLESTIEDKKKKNLFDNFVSLGLI